MSSGFVSGGTNDQPIERDDEWHRVQQELEDERRRKADLGKQDGGKSLYEALQQNKMAKQEAFEEKIKLRNQFRSLDEDEIEFLDSVLESTRAQEAAVKQDTAEQLEVFRRQREEAEKVQLEDASTDVGPPAEGEDWKIPARKRRRDKNKDLLVPGKKRKSIPEDVGGSLPQKEQKTVAPETAESAKSTSGSVATDSKVFQQKSGNHSADAGKPSQDAAQAKTNQTEKPASSSMGLVAYGSDSDSE